MAEERVCCVEDPNRDRLIPQSKTLTLTLIYVMFKRLAFETRVKRYTRSTSFSSSPAPPLPHLPWNAAGG